ncbi:MAG: hypothetical protein ACK4F7_04165 [Inhella sp.]
MRRPTPLIAALLVAASLLAPAQAQTKKQLIEKVLTIQKPQYEQFGQMMALSPVQPMVQQAAQVLRARVPEDKREAVGKAMDAELQAYLRDVTPALRASSLKHAREIIGSKLEASFSEAELKQLVDYLESPVIKRYNEMGPDFQQALGQKVAIEHKSLVETKARALDAKLVELLGIKPAAAPASK